MTNNIFKKLIIYISIICIIYSIIAFSFTIVPFIDKNLLLNLFDKYHIYDNLPFIISKEDVIKIVNDLMSYLNGKKDVLDTIVNLNGFNIYFHSDRSLSHMADCKNLFLSHRLYATIALIIGISGIIYTVKNVSNPFSKIFKIYKNVLIIVAVIISSLGIYAIINFDNFFINFHQLIFNNYDWYFDPDVDYIINFLPENIFIHIGVLILISILSLLLFVLLLIFLLHKIQSRQEAK